MLEKESTPPQWIREALGKTVTELMQRQLFLQQDYI